MIRNIFKEIDNEYIKSDYCIIFVGDLCVYIIY
jgi:hypothetical protein